MRDRGGVLLVLHDEIQQLLQLDSHVVVNGQASLGGRG